VRAALAAATAEVAFNGQNIGTVGTVDGRDVSADGANLDDLVTTTINDQTGTTYTFVLADGGEYVRCTNAAAITVTVPNNAAVAYPIGTQIAVRQGGAGQVTFAPGGGVTLNGDLSITAQNQIAVLVKIDTDEWDISGAVGDAAILETLFNANTILTANADNDPQSLTVAEQTLVGRITAPDNAVNSLVQKLKKQVNQG